MNYIELINQFWQIRRSRRITSLQADVYFCLLNECNLRGWENPFEISNGLICASIGISEPSLIDARNRLQQAGLIQFEKGIRKAKRPVYYLNNLSKSLSINRVKPLVKPLVKTEDKAEPNIIYNNNIINNKLKQNKTTPKSGVVVKDFIDQVIDEFIQSFSKIRGCGYEITNKGKERSAAGKLIKLYKDKNPNSESTKTIKDLGHYFDLCLSIENEWIYNNMSLSIIVSKFNEINTILRNGNKGRNSKKPATTTEELAGIVAKHFASDYPK